ncbi:MAG: hypothetical protein U7126_21040 [Microcoleus sp.]
MLGISPDKDTPSIYPVGLLWIAPGDYFRKPENRAKLKTDIETQSARQVSEADLDFFIKEWCRDIKQGLNPTTVRRDLPPIGIATPTSTPSPTRTSVPGGYDTRENGGNSTGGNSHNPPPKPPNPPQTETRSTNNQADF